ncbi:MAG: YraN family protein [Gammaproteobacteria bacterium]|nr:YraN family protein [Gammaproteobacteria bacterium]MBL6999990.1 YraN family protein [Gammaproteobacteria bacterium]
MQGGREKGDYFEQLALHWLQQQGLRMIEQNFNCRFGEIDLIMLDASTVCFIEVKYRKNNAFGGTAFSIPRSKQEKITRSALSFIATHKACQHSNYRFDALLIEPGTSGTEYRYEWIRNAFEASSSDFY